MKLYSLLNENHVLIGEKTGSIDEAMALMLKAFGKVLPDAESERVIANMIDRERLHPTLIAQHVCLPHMRMEELDQFLLGLMVPAEPVPHPGIDASPISMFFMILAPQNKNTMMLQTMAAIARLLRSNKNMQAMVGVKSPTRLIRMIEDSGIDVKKTLVAPYVMKPISHSVTAETVLVKAVDVLVAAPDEGVPVLDGQNKLVGELTSREILSLGMPKYLDLIVNPSMLDNFEPFENFFKHENTMSVRELCRHDVIQVTPDTPVVQVAHLMMTHQKRRVYVVEGDDLQGVIYRKDIVERVLHL
jgi:mannitol/fructose-specific phosphotransferase system IIA component (Ntr-type)/CBS domain-containing protein